MNIGKITVKKCEKIGKVGFVGFLIGLIYIIIAGRNHLNMWFPFILSAVGFCMWRYAIWHSSKNIRAKKRALEEQFITDGERTIWKNKRIFGGILLCASVFIIIILALYNTDISFAVGLALIGLCMFCFPRVETIPLCSFISCVGFLLSFGIMSNDNGGSPAIPLVFALGGCFGIFLIPFFDSLVCKKLLS